MQEGGEKCHLHQHPLFYQYRLSNRQGKNEEILKMWAFSFRKSKGIIMLVYNLFRVRLHHS